MSKNIELEFGILTKDAWDLVWILELELVQKLFRDESRIRQYFLGP